nr:hypothetical protein [uncultured Brevundimonas sp.]
MAHARVEDALALFLAALPRRLRFADVAGMLKLTPAELQAAFDAQGANPRDRLRHVRLQRLHDDLRRKRYDEVGLAMVRWGFPPRGNDAFRDYCRLFGCHPRETLQAESDQ